MHICIFMRHSIQNTSSRATEYTDSSLSDCKRTRVCGEVRKGEKEKDRGESRREGERARGRKRGIKRTRECTKAMEREPEKERQCVCHPQP